MFLGALLLAVLAAANQATLKDCSSASSEFTIRSLDFSPASPVPGENGTLFSVYEVPVQVDAGTTRYSCTLNGLPVYDETTDLCSQTKCPIEIGTHDDTSISAVPSASGKVVCKIDWRDTAGTQLLCIQMTLQLSADAPRLRGAVQRQLEPHFHTHAVRAPIDNGTCPRFDATWSSYASYSNVLRA
jgi:hypothetical protein